MKLIVVGMFMVLSSEVFTDGYRYMGLERRYRQTFFYADETNRIYSTSVYSNKVHWPLQPKSSQPSGLQLKACKRGNLITSWQAVAP
jgi:hypothetical protein